MSQPGNYRYQSYDQSGTLKGAIPPMINGQPSAMQHTQNGTQPPSFNSAGTPSSQSSRDPSRETSRDPSPTQYLHNQYRPQLSRPPMPPINGQQQQQQQQQQPPPPISNTTMSQPSRSIQSPQSSPLANNSQSASKQFPSVQMSNPAVFSAQTNQSTCPNSAQSLSSDLQIGAASHIQQSVTPMRYDVPSPNRNVTVKSDSQGIVDNQPRPSIVSQSGQFFGGQNLPNSSIAQSTVKSQIFNSSASWSKEQVTGSTNPPVNQPSDATRNAERWRNPIVESNSNNSPVNSSQSYSTRSTLSSNPSSVPPTGWSKDAPTIPVTTNPSASMHVNPNQIRRNPGAEPNSNDSRTTTQTYTGMLHQNPGAPPRTQPPSVQPIMSPVGSNYSQHSLGNKPNITNPGVNFPGPRPIGGPQATATVPLTNTGVQSIFGSATTNQPTTTIVKNQTSNLSSNPMSQQQHSALLKPQAQYPTAEQQSPSMSIPGGTFQSPNPGAYGSQQNVAASQWKYPQSGYSTQPPTGSPVITGPPHVGGSNVTGVNAGHTIPPPPLRLPPTATSVGAPPLPGQQNETAAPYDYRTPYFGQMSNVPLDNMNKRYPTATYPDQMNQLNAQVGNLNVTKTGFNEMWGQQSIDLLQCRNVLPGEKVEPPRIKLHQEFLDSVNCSHELFRCTLTKIPESNSLLQKCRLPLGVLIHPFKDLNHLPVIQCSTIVRCRACRTYINPFVYFVDSKRWKCNLCYRVNELPEEFQFDPVTKSYGDPSRRPEVKTSTIEFIAPSEYMLRPPQPAVYLFILDVSRLAVDSGYLAIACETIAEELTKLPGDGRTQVGFIAIDSAVHFFSMPENVSQPHELIMLDVEDIFLPCPDNLVVNLKEREELVRDLLEQLPIKFNGTHDTNSALGAGLQAAFKLMSPTGGRVTVFQTCLPNVGPGALQPREDPNTRASKDVPHLNPATDFYKRLALDCSGQQIAVDLFLLNSQYSDLATLAGMCKFSGGCIYHIPLFRRNKPQHGETLERMLRRYLTRKIGFEAVMRIRCTRGLAIHTFHGNFFVRSTDLLSLPNVNPDAGFGMQVSIEENLSDVQSVCFQAALLYTSSKGERRIRVHTLCLPVSSSMTDILYSADQQAIIGLLSKMAVDRSQQSSLSDARDALINVAIDVLSSYKLSQSTSMGGLMAPGNLKLLPLYIIALIKSMSFRSGTSTRLDDRVYAMCQMKALPLGQLMQIVYPDLYNVNALDDRNSRDIDGKVCPQSARIHLSAEKLDFRGVFLMDAGDRIYIYIGKSVDPMFCCNVLGVSSYVAIPEELYDLPELETVESERLRNFVFSLQEEKPYYAPLQIIRDDSHFKSLFIERLIEDRSENALSYYEFLQHLKTQVK